jgi:RHS repeat-associated protein
MDWGLMDYKARAYDPLLGRFIQPDTIIPNPADPQSWNRYSYVLDNPIIFSDPSGHGVDCGIGMGCVSDYVFTATRRLARDDRNGPTPPAPIPTPPPVLPRLATPPAQPPTPFPTVWPPSSISSSQTITSDNMLGWFDALTGPSPAGYSSPISGLVSLACGAGAPRCALMVDGALLTLNLLVHADLDQRAALGPYLTPTTGPSATSSATPLAPTPVGTWPPSTPTSPYLTPTYSGPTPSATFTASPSTPTSWFLP